MNKIYTIIFYFLCVCVSSQTFSAQDSTIKFANLTWESGQFTTAVLRQLIEKGYGYPTALVSGADVALESGLIQNDLQVIGEVWMGRSPVLAKGIAEKKVELVGDTLKGGTVQGWYIPMYIHEQYPQLKTVQDLAKFAKDFPDPQNPQKGRFLNCPTGWTCEIFNSHLLKNFHLDKLFTNQHPGTGAAMDSEIASYYAQKKPILFYYWQPSGLMANYDVYPLKFPPYDAKCWQEMLNPNSKSSCISDFPVSQLAVGVSTQFAKNYPNLLALMSKVQFNLHEMNQQIYEMTKYHRTGEEQAILFLKKYPTQWQKWVPHPIAQRIEEQLGMEQKVESHFFPQWSLQSDFNQGLQDVVKRYGSVFRELSRFLQQDILNPVSHTLLKIPAWLVIVFTMILGWHSTKRIVFALFSAIGLYLIGGFGLWQASMQTIALMFVSIGLTVLIGIPLGILFARTPRLYRIILPLLDVAQTMPSFVYLIPVLMLFGLGEVPAIFACLVYAIVPLIRLTVLGIRDIPKELLEAGYAFGSSSWQMLKWVILPTARPQIMAGLNQTVMMSLSMVVVASMIGASGLGQIILQAIQTLNVGLGLQAGGAIVILAIIVDRITQGYGAQYAPLLNQEEQRMEMPNATNRV